MELPSLRQGSSALIGAAGLLCAATLTLAAQGPANTAESPESRNLTWLTDLADIVPALDLAGRRISVRDVRVDDVDADGFWISSEQSAYKIRVVPAEGSLVRVRPGDTISVQGDFRRRPDAARDAVSSRGVYLYAYTVRPVRAM